MYVITITPIQFSDCPVPLTVNATVTADIETIGGADVVLNAGTADIECNFTLYDLDIDGTTQNTAETVTCNLQVWSTATDTWSCVPTCE